jgi:DHA2 family methylenomycin A resistance protein-like MFS transporter
VLLLDPASTLTDRRRDNLALAAICLGFLLITLDTTIVNVALGPIVADLGGSLAGAQWVVSAYTLAFASLLLSAGSLADRVGARRGYLIGVGIFALGSVLCAAAPSLGALIAARALQGVGAASLLPCSLALIAHAFPETARRRRALGVWAGVSGVGVAAGPVLGGLLVGTLGWRAIFAVNPPLAVAIIVVVLLTVEETPRRRERLDPLGQVLAIGALGALVAGFILTGERGWDAPATVSLLAAGAVLAAAFVAAELRVERPMVSPALFHRPAFSVSIGIAAIFNFALYGALFCLSLALHLGRGLTPMETGLALLPATTALGLTAFLSSRVIARIGEWRAIAIGLATGAAGAALMAIGADAPTGLLIAASLPLGLVSLAMPAMTAVALHGVPGAGVGSASGVLNGARQAGGAFGVAVLGSLLDAGGGISLRPAMVTVAVAYLVGLALSLTHVASGGR